MTAIPVAPQDTQAALPPAPRLTSGAAPLRRPGSVRRTTSIDVSWPQGRNQAMQFDARGRDLLTPAASGAEPQVLACDRVLARIGTDRCIEAIEATPPRPHIHQLISERGGGHLRSALDSVLPEERSAASPLYLLIDDFAGASLIAGWAWLRWAGTALDEPRANPDPAVVAAHFSKMEGICIGFRSGSSALRIGPGVDQNFAVVYPLPHPQDPAGWHDLPELPGVNMRRARRIDVWRDGDTIQIDAMFQDSASAPQGGRVAVHEYTLQAQADARSGTLLGVQAQPRILPYAECPSAVANLSRLHGSALQALRQRVLDELSRTQGCTHLNDAVRALAEAPALLQQLEARPTA